MKRRDFLSQAIAVASSLVPGIAVASRPCAPSLMADDGTELTTPCDLGDADADWEFRSGQPGVVWYHDFRTDAEVDNFRWAGGVGNDPGDTTLPGRCVRNASDGITGGGCLELIHPVGRGGAPGWWRPFSPLSGESNGRGIDDPGAGDTLAIQPWDPSNRSENERFRRGYYAHPSYIGADGFASDQFDGSEFWLQFRIKMDPNRYLDGTPSAGKLSFLATTQQTLNQEIVQMNPRNGVATWYTNFGNSPDTGQRMGRDQGYRGKQPGGDYDSCSLDTGAGCWIYSGGEWVTWLYHLVPGQDGVKDTLFEAYVARQGQTDYELVFSYLNTINFSGANTGHPKGYNAFQPSNYMNGQNSSVQWYQRYDQIVFSRQFIPCPQV